MGETRGSLHQVWILLRLVPSNDGHRRVAAPSSLDLRSSCSWALPRGSVQELFGRAENVSSIFLGQGLRILAQNLLGRVLNPQWSKYTQPCRASSWTEPRGSLQELFFFGGAKMFAAFPPYRAEESLHKYSASGTPVASS